MAEDKDALRDFDFNKVTGGGLFLKFKAGEAVTLRILTTDPVMSVDSKYGGTYFGFIVYNFTEGKAQILNATPGVAKRIQALHFDEDFGANIRKIDLKITPSGEKLERKYEIQVLPTTKDLTNDMVLEAKAIDLEETIAKGAGFTKRMSLYDQDEFNRKQKEFAGGEDDEPIAPSKSITEDDVVIDDDEPINLDDIPF